MLSYAWQMERIISMTDLVRNAARIAKDVESEGTIYRITRGGRSSMVLVDNEYYEGWMATIDEMRRPDWREALAQGRRDAAAGRGRSLDVIAKELGLERLASPQEQNTNSSHVPIPPQGESLGAPPIQLLRSGGSRRGTEARLGGRDVVRDPLPLGMRGSQQVSRTDALLVELVGALELHEVPA